MESELIKSIDLLHARLARIETTLIGDPWFSGVTGVKELTDDMTRVKNALNTTTRTLDALNVWTQKQVGETNTRVVNLENDIAEIKKDQLEHLRAIQNITSKLAELDEKTPPPTPPSSWVPPQAPDPDPSAPPAPADLSGKKMGKRLGSRHTKERQAN